MSYILDALKKSDQQRQRGAVPPLNTMQTSVATPRRNLSAYYVAIATMLIGAGVVVGWLRPWQAEQPKPVTTSKAVVPPIPIVQQNAPLTSPVVQHEKSDVNNVSSTAKEKSPPAGTPEEQPMFSINDLPAQIRQEIPEMKVQLHAYADIPGERLVSINDIRLREGEFLVSGLKLEQITPDGMIFSYKGYRFQRGIRF